MRCDQFAEELFQPGLRSRLRRLLHARSCMACREVARDTHAVQQHLATAEPDEAAPPADGPARLRAALGIEGRQPMNRKAVLLTRVLPLAGLPIAVILALVFLLTPAANAGLSTSPSSYPKTMSYSPRTKGKSITSGWASWRRIQAQKSSSLMARKPRGSVTWLSDTMPRAVAVTSDKNSQKRR